MIISFYASCSTPPNRQPAPGLRVPAPDQASALVLAYASGRAASLFLQTFRSPSLLPGGSARPPVFCDILVPGFVFWLHGGVCYAFRLNICRYNFLRSVHKILALNVFSHIPPGRFSAAEGASLCSYVPRLFLPGDAPRRDCR